MTPYKTDLNYSKKDRKTLKFSLQSACSGSETQRLSQSEKQLYLYRLGTAFRDHSAISIQAAIFLELDRETNSQKVTGMKWVVVTGGTEPHCGKCI